MCFPALSKMPGSLTRLVHDIERAAGAVTLVEVVLSPGHTSALKFVSIARYFIHGPQRQICFKNNSRHLAI